MFPTLPRWSPWLYTALVLLLTSVLLMTPTGTAGLMLAPAAAVLLMLLVVTREGWHRAGWTGLGLHRAGLRYWFPAAAIPLGIFTVGHLLVWAQPDFALGATGAAPDDTGLALAGGLLATTLVAAVTTVLAEEIGWRGYLLPRLLRFGERRALLLSGLIHALWHVPVILLTGLYHAHGNPWISVPLFVVVGVSGGVLMGYLRLRAGSLWPAVVAHAVHNASWTYLGAFTLGGATTLELLAGERGVFTATGYLVVAAVVLGRPVSVPERAETPLPAGATPAPVG